MGEENLDQKLLPYKPTFDGLEGFDFANVQGPRILPEGYQQFYDPDGLYDPAQATTEVNLEGELVPRKPYNYMDDWDLEYGWFD